MALTLQITPAEGPLSRVRLQPGSNRFSVRVGDTFRIYDDQTGLTPPGIAVKRVDNSLVVDGLPGTGEPTVVEFAEFYTLCSVGSPCQLEVQEQATAAPILITPGSPSIGALADGAFVLYDPSYEPPPEPPGQPGSVDTRTVLYGVGGLAVAGLALGGGGGGSGDSGPGGGPAPPDGTLKFTSSTFVNDRTPLITGQGEPGAQIVVRIDTDGDGVPNVTYATTVAADFNWSVDLGTAAPESGALPPDGLPDISTIGISSTSGGGNVVSLPAFQLAFDGTPPAPATVDPVAIDNIVNAAERQAGVSITGGAEPGSNVLLTWGTQSIVAPVDAAGRWEAIFAAEAVPADGTQPVIAIVQDPAGNNGPAVQLEISIDTAPPTLTVATVAGGDGTVSIADAAAVRFSGTTDPGAAVNLNWHGIQKPATVAQDGGWQVEFAGPEVPAGAGESFAYTIVATDAVGNSAQVDGQVLVDREAPAAPAIALVSGDDRISVGERGSAVDIFGTAEAGARVAVSWGGASRTVTAGGDGNWTARFGSDDLPSAPVPGANVNVTATATDAVGNAGPTSARPVFVEQPFPPPTIGTVADDDVVNAADRAGGITLSGTAHPVAPSVLVTWGAFSGTVNVSNGGWQIVVPENLVPGDGNAAVNASITGAPGASASRNVRIDTTPPGPPAIDAIEGDNRVTVVERADGVSISGTAEAGASVNVDWNGNGKVATANGAGVWSVTYSAGEVPLGGDTTVTARATDSDGNQGGPTVRVIVVDPPFLAPTIADVEADNVVSAAERDDGVVLSGTVQPGVTAVNVAWGGFSGAADVAGANWSIVVPAGQVPGDGATTVVATIAGPGGGASQSKPVTVDTTGPATAIAAVTGDDVISILEIPAFTVSGTTEPNATVVVTLGTRSQTVTANAAGAWETGLYGPFDLPLGGGEVSVTATATDPYGNLGPPQMRTFQVESTLFGIISQEVLLSGEGFDPFLPIIAGVPASGSAVAFTEPSAPGPMDPLGNPLLAIENPIPHLG